MKLFIHAFLLCLLLSLAGCAQMFTSKTTVHVEVTDGAVVCKADYTSGKEQEDLVATICGGTIKTAKSGTLESVVAGVSALQNKLADTLGKLTDAAAKAGALSGS